VTPHSSEIAGERGERIAKWLARSGVASRREAEQLIVDGRVRLNETVVTHPATFVMSGDVVGVDGRAVNQSDHVARLWRYHKPAGLLVTRRDPERRPTIYERLPAGLPVNVISVGRLDFLSEGLLLLTNDGALGQRLESAGWVSRYRVRVQGAVTEEQLAAHRPTVGATLDGRLGPNTWFTVSSRACSGEVRAILASLGVTRSIRVAYGPFRLDKLPPGQVVEVNARVLREQLPTETYVGASPHVRTESS
jgi:23S rRNA pseudouridine2605 synthase